MNINIVLTNYLLVYMYGNRVFQNPFLLSLEIVKKAYHESLYYISDSASIDCIFKNPEIERSIFVFAGIPSFQEVCIHFTPARTLTALKLKLPYELLAGFQYKKGKEAILEKHNIMVRPENLEKVTLYLTYKENGLCYEEKESNFLFTEEMERVVLKNFGMEIRNYVYEITKNINFLKEKLECFFRASSSKKKLDDEEFLQMVKEIYEEFWF